MAGLLDFGDTENEKRQNMGLLAMLAGGSILGANQPGVSTGQALGAGITGAGTGLMQMQKMQQQAAQQKAMTDYRNAMMQPQSVREYEYAKQNGFGGSFEDYRNQVMGRNEVPASIREWQAFNDLSKEDQARYLNMKRANNYQNFGGFMGLPNPAQPGQFQALVPKTPPPEQMPEFKGDQARESAAGKVQGSTQATAAVNLPQTAAQAEQTLGLVDNILNDPAFSNVVGMPGSVSGLTSKMGAPIPGTPEAGLVAKIDQLGGQQFLQAFETLKGGGQITEVEGNKATDAISRMMKTNQSEESYRQAAEEFKSIVKAGVERAKKKAGMAPQSGASGGWSIQRVD